ncbi:amidohydrolase family protein [Nonomuraea sp. NPDC050556]|uniref:amidohydrolase family protein n=1 Tax=Nonomuraea sp. NPDC050556 TaxID=3364369 RepID=UPI0037887C38
MVVDAHNHLGRWLTGDWAVPSVPDLLAMLDSVGVTTVVNLDGRWGDELETNLDRYDRAHPGRFVTFCHVSFDRPEAMVASLVKSAEAGAAGLKVWKDLGLHIRDDRGDLVLPDDVRLAPVWEAAASLGLPVWIHTADPVAFFEPVDASNERRAQLLVHPEWSFCDPVFPRFERLIASLESLVAANPATTFVGVHAGCYPENLDWVGRMLDTYPHFNIDIAARLAEIGRVSEAARALILRHPDRVLFGTDDFPPSAETYATHYRFLETADEDFPHGDILMGDWTISGLDLPAAVLRSVYHDNAVRLIPKLHAR